MIKVEDSKLELQGSLTDILTDSHVGIIGTLQFLRKYSDEITMNYLLTTARLLKGYTEGMNNGLSHNECSMMALRSMEE